MKSYLYNAAVGGTIDILKGFSASEVESQETPQKNTVLHVAVQVASARKAPYDTDENIRQICELFPSLIGRKNSEGDTPLHIATRGGRYDIVRLLIDQARSHDVEVGTLVTMVNSKKDTALHEALRNHHLSDGKYRQKYLDIVKKLIEEAKELSNFINDASESPVFIAAREGLDEFLEVILESSSQYGGPGKMTALHAAVLLGEEGEKIAKEAGNQPGKTKETKTVFNFIVEKLMEKKPDLIKEEDESGRTPLHYAAILRSDKKLKRLLELVDSYNQKSVAYLSDKNGMTALHHVIRTGARESIDKLIECCPDCFEQVDDRGWTSLHFAVAGGSDDSIIKYFVKNEKLIIKNEKLKKISLGMVNDKNVDTPMDQLKSISMAMVNLRDRINGDTPLHLAARFSNSKALKFLMDIPDVDLRALNNDSLTASDIFKAAVKDDSMDVEKKSLAEDLKKKTGEIQQQQRSRELEKGSQKTEYPKTEDKKKKENEGKSNSSDDISEVREIQVVVATLIATVSFAASFTMPGGYNGDGMATFSAKGGFYVFTIANTVAMALSTAAIFVHLDGVKRFKKIFDPSIDRADLFILFAIGGMVIAFVTGTYLELANNPQLAIATALVACFLFFGAVGLRLVIIFFKYCFKCLSNQSCLICCTCPLWCPFLTYLCVKSCKKKPGDDKEKEKEKKPSESSAEV